VYKYHYTTGISEFSYQKYKKLLLHLKKKKTKKHYIALQTEKLPGIISSMLKLIYRTSPIFSLCFTVLARHGRALA